MTADDLVRFSEVCGLLNVCRTRAYQLTARPSFPAPFAVGTDVKLWRRADVEQWAKDRAERLAAKGTK